MAVSLVDRRLIRDYSGKLKHKELAKLFGVSVATIKRVLKDEHSEQARVRADMVESMLGGATVDDGCYNASVPKNSLVPDSQIDNNDPLAVLLAEETVKERVKK